MNSRAFLSPAQSPSASFDPNLLYQFKIDNNGDAIEDRVIQVTFSGSGADQQVEVRGPVAPPVPGAMKNEVASAARRRVRADQHHARLRDRHAGLRRPARRSVLHRSRAVLPHPAGPEAGDRRALAAARRAERAARSARPARR